MTQPEADPTIICPDCGDVAHLLSHPPPDAPFAPGEVLAYRCSGCGDRWDVLLPDDPGD